ncbi:Alpha/Beta hydrolase protein [Cladochytrium replicatum]|nr:Alpha/Beta hydrolase protein [Cladochytrium replicatum]
MNKIFSRRSTQWARRYSVAPHRIGPTVPLEFSVAEPANGVPQNHQPMLILHGLFGSKQNWRSLSKSMAQRLQTNVYALDLRNHGESPHSHIMNYEAMAADVSQFIQQHQLNEVNLVGHSMGGKVAMALALSGDPLVKNLIVVDISPTDHYLSSLFGMYVQAMQEVERSKVSSQAEADRILANYVPEVDIRLFLLTNLKKAPGRSSFTWRINLPVIAENLNEIWKFPYDPSDPSRSPKFENPTLFIAGAKGKYITERHIPNIKAFFPKAEIKSLDTGHWVHAEKPIGFQDLIQDFLERSNSTGDQS